MKPPSSICTIVIPCFNEASRLNKAAFETFVRQFPIRFLFVNDGSHDDTLEQLKLLAARAPESMAVLDLQPNRGKAEAVRVGMLEVIARGGTDIVGFWDADLATPLSELPRFLEIFDEHPHLVMLLGSRVRLLGRCVERKLVRHYLGRIFATCASLTLRLPVYDTQCGAKLFRVSPHLDAILSDPFESRWIFDVEILARFIQSTKASKERAEDLIHEEPLREWRDVGGSKVSPGAFFVAFFDLLRIRGRYAQAKSTN